MVGIYDSGFNTPLPNTDIAGQLMALRMRNAALNAEPLISGLSDIGKVFTDAAADQRKANTAILQRKIDMLTPEQMESLVTQGIDPITEAYKQGIPINIADAALNRAWDADIVNAQKEAGNKWVATVLPVIPYEDRLALLQGDPNVFKKWGLTDFKYVNPEVRTFIQENLLKSTATFEAEKAAAGISAQKSMDSSTDPYTNFYEGIDPAIASRADRTIPRTRVDSTRTEMQDMATTGDTIRASQGLPTTGNAAIVGKPSITLEQKSAIDSQYTNQGLQLYKSWQQQNPNGRWDEFLSSPEFATISAQHHKALTDSGLPDNEESILTDKSNLSRFIELGIDNNDTLTQELDRRTGVNDSRIPEIKNFSELSDYLLKKKAAENTKQNNLAKTYDKRVNDFVYKDIFDNDGRNLIEEVFKNGITKAELEKIRTDFNETITEQLGKEKDLAELYKIQGKDIFDMFSKFAIDEGQNREQLEQQQVDQAKSRLQGKKQHVLRMFGKTGSSVTFPGNISKLTSGQMDAVASTLLRNFKVNGWYRNADDKTKLVMVWYALERAGLLNDSLDINDLKSFEKNLNDSYLARRGINDQDFLADIEDIFTLGIKQRFKNEKEQASIVSLGGQSKQPQ